MSEPFLFTTNDQRSPAHTAPQDPGQAEMPAWLVDKLTVEGHIDAATGATRRARAALCPQCGRTVMIGMDSDTTRPHGGYSARVADPTPLGPVGEVLALLAGRLTVQLTWRGDHYEIDTRGTWEIRLAPPQSQVGTDVLVIHDCTRSHLPLPRCPSTVKHPFQRVADLPEEAPF